MADDSGNGVLPLSAVAIAPNGWRLFGYWSGERYTSFHGPTYIPEYTDEEVLDCFSVLMHLIYREAIRLEKEISRLSRNS